MTEKQKQQQNFFPEEKHDIFNGITIDLTKLDSKTTVEEFTKTFSDALTKWTATKKRGIWFKIPTEKSKFIPVLVEKEFDFHHALPGYSMMTRWLPKDEENKIPPFAFSYLAACGAVIDKKNEKILLVQEKYDVHSKTKKWKLPGGMLNLGEDIGTGAKREVFEETGVQTEQVGLLGFRHQSNFYFGREDCYFVNILEPKTFEINFDPGEIGDCQWIPLKEYYTFDTGNKVQTEAAVLIQKYMEDGKILNTKDISYSNRVATMYKF
eukprot:gene7160-11473_t